MRTRTPAAWFGAAFLGAVLAIPAPSPADEIRFDLDPVFKERGWAGSNMDLPPIPSGTPFATFTDRPDGTVQLRMDLGGVTGSQDYYYLRNWLFNFDDEKFAGAGGVETLRFTYESALSSPGTQAASAVHTGRDGFEAPSVLPPDADPAYFPGRPVVDHPGHLGAFDINFEFSFPDGSPMEFGEGEHVTYTIASTAGSLSVADFDFASADRGHGVYSTGAGIWPSCENYEQWYGYEGGNVATTGAGPGVVPEPGTLVLLGSGLLGLGGLGRRRTARPRSGARAS